MINQYTQYLQYVLYTIQYSDNDIHLHIYIYIFTLYTVHIYIYNYICICLLYTNGIHRLIPGSPVRRQDLCHFCRWKVSRAVTQLLCHALNAASKLGCHLAVPLGTPEKTWRNSMKLLEGKDVLNFPDIWW